jgi:hypothetical protein
MVLALIERSCARGTSPLWLTFWVPSLGGRVAASPSTTNQFWLTSYVSSGISIGKVFCYSNYLPKDAIIYSGRNNRTNLYSGHRVVLNQLARYSSTAVELLSHASHEEVTCWTASRQANGLDGICFSTQSSAFAQRATEHGTPSPYDSFSALLWMPVRD